MNHNESIQMLYNRAIINTLENNFLVMLSNSFIPLRNCKLNEQAVTQKTTSSNIYKYFS